MKKAIDYVKLVNPVQLNDLELQMAMWDRRIIYKILLENGIPVA
jgi:hypothetical protein